MSPCIILKELPPVESRGCSDFLVQLYHVRGEGKEKGRREEREREGKEGKEHTFYSKCRWVPSSIWEKLH